ncbi:MAG: dihydrolipoyllysine-residue acetyltransferase [Vulcanimicrobiaceae bacterium]
MEIRVPDIGGFADVPVIEILVKPGDRVKQNDSLVVLESDKASMEVPAPSAGVVETVVVSAGDKVSQGSVIVTLKDEPVSAAPVQPSAPISVQGAPGDTLVELRVPDIGDFKEIPVIDVLVKPGDAVAKEASLVTLESDKASMDVPANVAGTIEEVRVKMGDRVSQGTVIATLRSAQVPSAAPAPAKAEVPSAVPQPRPPQTLPVPQTTAAEGSGAVHASPAIRRFARELGVDLHGLHGSGPNGRITREDVQGYVKRSLQTSPSAAAAGSSFAGLPAWPNVDFAQYGAIERKPLSRIKKISGPNLHRNWLQIPHITNYDQADITSLEAFRNDVNEEQAKRGGAKLTMLAFLIKACVNALQRFPEFNTSLAGDDLIYKRYYNIGFAADTPSGLMVPVLKDADRKGLLEIAAETAALASKARDGKLGLADMQGGTFTISSIGGIGGTQFTQIVNAPEVAILGAARAAIQPVWDGSLFEPRLMLPLSVSYDHRVIDGAGAARFLVYVAGVLHDFRRITL